MNTIIFSIIAPIIAKHLLNQTTYQCFLIFAFFFTIAIGVNAYFRITELDKAVHDFVVKKGGYMDILPLILEKNKVTYFEIGKIKDNDVYFILATKDGVKKKITIPFNDTKIKYVDSKESAKVEFVQTRHIIFNKPGRSIFPYVIKEAEFRMNIPEVKKK